MYEIRWPGADPGGGGGRWGARPPLGRSFTIQNTLFNSIQSPVHHWAPTPGRNPVSAPADIFLQYAIIQINNSEISLKKIIS